MPAKTTSLYQAAVRENARTWRLKVTIHPDSELEPLVLTEENITLGSFVFEESSIGSDTLDVGSTYANSLQFALENPDQKYSALNFSYAKVFAYVGLLVSDPDRETETWEDVPIGEFFVQEDGKKMSTIPLQCFDRMVQLNAPVKQLRDVVLSNGKEVMDTIRMKYGFTILPGTQNLIDTLRTPLDYSVIADDLTCRDFVGYCAAYFGQNARFNRRGQLEFFCHTTINGGLSDDEVLADNTIVTTTPDTRMSGFGVSDRLVQINGVTVQDAYGNARSIPAADENANGATPEEDRKTDTEQESDYHITVSPNPLILTEGALAEAAQNTYTMYAQTPYLTFSTAISGDPAIQAGDPVRHFCVNGTDGHIDSIITRHVFKFRGNSTIEAKGKSPEENRQLTAANKKIIELGMSASRDLNDRIWTLDEMVQMQFSTLTNALGFYTTCVRDEASGAVIQFIIQDTDPESGVPPQNQWIFDGEKFISKMDGEITLGVSADGSIFAQRVLAKFLKTGLIESADGSVVIDLENGVIRNRTESGSTELTGESVLIQYMDGQNHRHVCGMNLQSGQKDAQGNYIISILFTDQEGNAVSGITQKIAYDSQNRPVAEPLTTSDLRVQSNLEVVNAILYDKIQFQRKANEPGNTGVDFVVMEG